MQNKGSDKAGAGCLFLFGLPFFCAGLFAVFAYFAGTVKPAENAWIAAALGGFFMLIGGGIMAAAIWVVKSEKAENANRQKFPNEPWRWKTEWKDGVIKDSSGGAILGLVVFTVFWNGLSWPAFIALLLKENGFKDPAAYLVLFFPAIGLIMFGALIYTVLRKQKYGRSFLHLETFPGVIGGELRGVVKIPASVYPESGFRVHIGNYKEYTTGSGKNRRTSENMIWEDEVQLKDIKRRNRQTEVPISFVIPSNSKATTLSNPGHDSLWRLTLEAKTMGIDYKTMFKVPVFVTEESQDGVDPDKERREVERQSAPEDHESFRNLCKELAIIYERPAHGQLKLHYPAGKKLGPMAGLFIFFIIWTGAIVGMLMSGRVPILFPIVFGLFDLFFLIILLNAVFSSSTISIASKGLELTKKFMFFGSPRIIPFDELKDIKEKTVMQSGSKQYYKIQILTTDRKKVTVGRMCPDKKKIGRIIREINAAIEKRSESF